jgi:hypothetical protein
MMSGTALPDAVPQFVGTALGHELCGSFAAFRLDQSVVVEGIASGRCPARFGK